MGGKLFLKCQANLCFDNIRINLDFHWADDVNRVLFYVSSGLFALKRMFS